MLPTVPVDVSATPMALVLSADVVACHFRNYTLKVTDVVVNFNTVAGQGLNNLWNAERVLAGHHRSRGAARTRRVLAACTIIQHNTLTGRKLCLAFHAINYAMVRMPRIIYTTH